MDKFLIATLVLATIIGIFIIISAVAGIYFYVRFINVKRSSKRAIYNGVYGKREEGKLSLKLFDLVYPSVPNDGSYSIEVSRYACDLIARIEKMFHQVHDKVHSLHLPESIFLVSRLNYQGRLLGIIVQHAHSAEVWIVFRGTNNTREMIDDLQYGQTSYGSPTENGVPGIRCHSGFTRVFDNIWPCLNASISNLDIAPSKVIISGHSLGAAVATLVALRFSNHLTFANYPVHLYTFGAPRVCDTLPDENMHHWRIINTADPIPSLPLAVMPNLINPESPLFFTHGGQSVTFTENLLSLSNNHMLATYVNGLKENKKQDGVIIK